MASAAPHSSLSHPLRGPGRCRRQLKALVAPSSSRRYSPESAAAAHTPILSAPTGENKSSHSLFSRWCWCNMSPDTPQVPQKYKRHSLYHLYHHQSQVTFTSLVKWGMFYHCGHSWYGPWDFLSVPWSVHNKGTWRASRPCVCACDDPDQPGCGNSSGTCCTDAACSKKSCPWHHPATAT